LAAIQVRGGLGTVHMVASRRVDHDVLAPTRLANLRRVENVQVERSAALSCPAPFVESRDQLRPISRRRRHHQVLTPLPSGRRGSHQARLSPPPPPPPPPPYQQRFRRYPRRSRWPVSSGSVEILLMSQSRRRDRSWPLRSAPLDPVPSGAAGVEQPGGQLLVGELRAATDVVQPRPGDRGRRPAVSPAVVVTWQPFRVLCRRRRIADTLLPSNRLVTKSGMTFSGNC